MGKRLLVLSVFLVPLIGIAVQAQIILPGPANSRDAGLQDPDKRSRTLVQKKIDSQLQAAARSKDQGSVKGKTSVVYDDKGRAAVDISATVTDELLSTIQREGGEISNSFPQFNSVRAFVTLDSLERIAALSDVRFISRAAGLELSAASETGPHQNQPKQETQPPVKPETSLTSSPKITHRHKSPKKSAHLPKRRRKIARWTHF